MLRWLILIPLFCFLYPASTCAQTLIDTDFNEYVASGIISANNLLTEFPQPKSTLEKPFSIDVTYKGSGCNAELNSIYVSNSRFPLLWYAMDEEGGLSDPLINPKPSQLQDHTTYFVQDFYFHSDTVYVDFVKSFEFLGLHPNPVSQNAILNYSAYHTIPVSLAIYDVYGKIIFSETTSFLEGENELKVAMRYIDPGTYFLNVSCECIQQTIKFVNAGL